MGLNNNGGKTEFRFNVDTANGDQPICAGTVVIKKENSPILKHAFLIIVHTTIVLTCSWI